MYEQMELSRRSQNNETKEADQLHVRWLCNETMTDTYVQVHYSHYFKEVWPWFCSNQHETSICINFVRTDESLTIYNKYPHSVAFFKQWEKSEASNMLTSFLPEWHLSLTISHHHPYMLTSFLREWHLSLTTSHHHPYMLTSFLPEWHLSLTISHRHSYMLTSFLPEWHLSLTTSHRHSYMLTSLDRKSVV